MKNVGTSSKFMQEKVKHPLMILCRNRGWQWHCYDTFFLTAFLRKSRPASIPFSVHGNVIIRFSSPALRRYNWAQYWRAKQILYSRTNNAWIKKKRNELKWCRHRNLISSVGINNKEIVFCCAARVRTTYTPQTYSNAFPIDRQWLIAHTVYSLVSPPTFRCPESTRKQGAELHARRIWMEI